MNIKQDKFIKKATERYNGKYSYNNFTYTNKDTASYVTCSIHGDFLQKPKQHLIGTVPCPNCLKELNNNQENLNTKLTTQEFIQKCLSLYSDPYDYSSTIYVNNKTEVSINCPSHGEFKITPSNIFRYKRGCSECKRGLEARKLYFLERATTVHGEGTYTYNMDTFTSFNDPVTITCKDHGTYQQTANRHLAGTGCKGCGESLGNGWGLDAYKKVVKDNLCYLYVIKCKGNGEEFYKVGITKHKDLRKRFRSDKLPYTFEVIKLTEGTVDFIWNLEKKAHKYLLNFQYTPIKTFGGRTECYDNNCLSEINNFLESNSTVLEL